MGMLEIPFNRLGDSLFSFEGGRIGDLYVEKYQSSLVREMVVEVWGWKIYLWRHNLYVRNVENHGVWRLGVHMGQVFGNLFEEVGLVRGQFASSILV